MKRIPNDRNKFKLNISIHHNNQQDTANYNSQQELKISEQVGDKRP